MCARISLREEYDVASKKTIGFKKKLAEASKKNLRGLQKKNLGFKKKLVETSKKNLRSLKKKLPAYIKLLEEVFRRQYDYRCVSIA